jgi:hypothetical protein
MSAWLTTTSKLASANGSEPPKGLPGEHAGPAADVEDLVTRPDPGGVGDRARPGAEDRGNEAGFVDFGSVH